MSVNTVLRVLSEIIWQKGDAVVTGTGLRENDAFHVVQRKIGGVWQRETGG